MLEREVPVAQARSLVQGQVGVVADLLLVVGPDVVCMSTSPVSKRWWRCAAPGTTFITRFFVFGAPA